MTLLLWAGPGVYVEPDDYSLMVLRRARRARPAPPPPITVTVETIEDMDPDEVRRWWAAAWDVIEGDR